MTAPFDTALRPESRTPPGHETVGPDSVPFESSRATGDPGEDTKKLRTEVSRLSQRLDHFERQAAQFRSCLDKAPHPICFADAKGIITFANTAFSELFCPGGRPLQGKNLFSLFSETWAAGFRQILNGLSPENPCGRTSSISYNGTMVQHWEMSATFAPSGIITGYQIQGRDGTAQETLKRVEDSIATVFDKSPLCLAYAENLKIQRVTTALCELLGYTREELLGKSLPLPQIYEDEKDMNYFTSEEKLREGDPSLRETRLRTKGGKIFDALILIIPLRLNTNQTKHFFFIRDISRNKELEKQHIRTELLLQHSSVVLFQQQDFQAPPLDYISENVFQFGYTSQQLMETGLSMETYVHKEDLPLLMKEDKKDRENGKQDREYTYRIKRADGKYRWVNQKSHVIPTRDGIPDTVIGILMDVTSQIEAKQALRQNHAMLEEKVELLEKTWEQTIGLLAAVTELRDPYTMGHQKRVAHLSGAIAAEMDLDEPVIQETVRAALVHDIGKIKVPSDFLSKPGKLTDKEFSIIQDHSTDGAKLLGKIDLPWPITDIVRQHHERLDGSGYPKGLKGDEILLPARIIAVADVVEAMASHRPYRPALGIERALVEISALSGVYYDPEVVSVCRNLFLRKNYHWPKENNSTTQTEPSAKKRNPMASDSTTAGNSRFFTA